MSTGRGTTGTVGVGGFGGASTAGRGTTGGTTGTSSWGKTGTGTGTTGGVTGWGGGGTGRGTGFGGFGATQPNYQAVLIKDPLFDRIWNLRCAYNPDSTGYRFCYAFYNRRLTEDNPQPPANIPESDWVKIMKDCPDPEHLVPCPIYGFDALHERAASQKQIAKELSQRMVLVQAKLREMTSFYSTELRGAFEKIQHNAAAINQMMMEVVETEEVQRLQGAPLSTAESDVLDHLEQVKLDLSKPGAFYSAINELKMKTEGRAVEADSTEKSSLDKESLISISTTLKNNQDGIEALDRVVKELRKEVALIDLSVSELR